jgi:ribosomal-protein-serine acetyltransferase
MFYFDLGSGVQLRLLEKRHALALFELTDSCRPYLRQWLPWVDGTKSFVDTEKFIEMTRQKFASNDGFQAGIWERDQIVGVIGYYGVDWSNRKTSIGYWMGEKHQGQGLMTSACKALVNHALIDLKLNRVEIRCATENKKSQAIPERLGFKNEGVIRQAEWLYDHFVDHVCYGVLASEWRG